MVNQKLYTDVGSIIVAVLAACFFYSTAGASPRAEVARLAPETDTSGIGFALNLFQRFISPADGERCPMAPTCSAYAKTAVRRHGSLMGFVMTCDRLMRCGRDEMKRARTVRSGQYPKFWDPVENNDFWWRKPLEIRDSEPIP